MLKLAADERYSILLESVEGGAVRGRYSVLAYAPDLIWRCRGNAPEINRRALDDHGAFEAAGNDSLASLSALVAESRIALPDGMPPMSAGLFGSQIGRASVRGGGCQKRENSGVAG